MICLLLICFVLIAILILLLRKPPIDAEIENTAAICLFENHKQIIEEQKIYIQTLKDEIAKKDQALAIIQHAFPVTFGNEY